MRKRRFAKVASGALVALTLGLGLLPSKARAADVPITEEARTHFAAGVALLQDPKAPRYEDAYREFKAAYAASPSYKILGNLGLSAMKIERDAEAIEAYEKYLKEAGPELSQPEREQAQRDLLTLKAGVVTVTVSSDPPGARIDDVRTPIEGNDIRNDYGQASQPLTLGLRRGHHVITARLEGYVDQRWEFEASGTTLPPHAFTMVKPSVTVSPAGETTSSRPLTTAAYVSGAVTLGLATAGLVFGLAAVTAHNSFNQDNTGQSSQSESQAQSDKNRGQTFNIVADSCFGGAVLGAALTTYFVLSRPTVERPIAATVERGLTVRPTPMGAGGAGGGLAAVWVY